MTLIRILLYIKTHYRFTLSILITVFYLVTVFAFAYFHEPFCDELNVSMVLKNYSGKALIEYIMTDGNPPWFFIISYPLVKAGLSFFSIQVLCVLFNAAAVFVLNAFSPFPIMLNLAITLSAPFLYFYPVISRCYSLMPFFFIVAALSYSMHGRNLHLRYGEELVIVYALAIGAIAGSHVITLGFAAAAYAIMLYDSRKKILKKDSETIIAIIVAFVPLSFMLLQSAVALNTAYDISLMSFSFDSAKHTVLQFFASFFDASAGDSLFSKAWLKRDSTLYVVFTYFNLLVTAAITSYFFKIKLKYGIIALTGITFPLYVHIKHPIIFPFRVYLCHLIFLFLFWTVFEKEKISVFTRKIGLAMLAYLFIITVPSGFYAAFTDLKQPFSAAEDIAHYIKQNITDDENTVIIASIPWQIASVPYYLDRHKIYANNGKMVDAVLLHSRFKNLTSEISPQLHRKKIYYLIPKFYKEDMSKKNAFILLHETPDSLARLEDFCLYSKVPVK